MIYLRIQTEKQRMTELRGKLKDEKTKVHRERKVVCATDLFFFVLGCLIWRLPHRGRLRDAVVGRGIQRFPTLTVLNAGRGWREKGF